MFSITPKAFDAVDVVSAFGTATIFSDNNVLAAYRQPGIGLPVVRVIKTAGSGMLDDQLLNGGTPSSLNRKDSDHAVALKDAEHDDFTGSTPTSLSFAMAAKHRLIAFDLPGERLGTFFGNAQHLSDDTKELSMVVREAGPRKRKR